MKVEEEYEVYFDDARKVVVYAKSAGHAMQIARRQGIKGVYEAQKKSAIKSSAQLMREMGR